MRWQFFLGALIIAIFLPISPLSAADWTAFRGADGNGKSPDTGLLQQWPTGGPMLLWTANDVGFGYSGVSIADGRIYTTGNIGDLAMVFCLDMDGKELWRSDNGPAAHTIGSTVPQARNYPGTRGNVTIDGDFVYDVSPLGNVTAFEAQTGRRIWSRNLVRELNAPMPTWLFGHAAIIDGDNLITLVGGSTIAVALNKRTGETAWQAASAQGAPASYTTPYIFEFDGIRVVAVMSNESVEGLDPATGRTLFSIPWANDRNVHCTMPIYHNGHLFLSTGYGGGTARLFRLTKNADGTITATQQWVDERFNNHHGGVVMVGTHVYGTNHVGAWCSINFMTGEIGYVTRSSVAGKGSVVYADGLLYGLTENDRTVLLMRPTPERFVLVSSFELPNDAAGPSWAHPVVIGGKMYLRHGRYLYCYDVRR